MLLTSQASKKPDLNLPAGVNSMNIWANLQTVDLSSKIKQKEENTLTFFAEKLQSKVFEINVTVAHKFTKNKEKKLC